jgi:hypothetical protein
MNEVYQVMSDRFHGEISDLDILVQRIKRAWEFARSSASEQDMFLDSVALGLHGFYSGIESLFLQVATHLDDKVPQGDGWHAQLLTQMRDESQVRPALISPEDIDFLDELRRFRHLVRNVYAFNLLPDRIEPLVEQVTQKWPKLRSELTAFEVYISSLLTEGETI